LIFKHDQAVVASVRMFESNKDAQELKESLLCCLEASNCNSIQKCGEDPFQGYVLVRVWRYLCRLFSRFPFHHKSHHRITAVHFHHPEPDPSGWVNWVLSNVEDSIVDVTLFHFFDALLVLLLNCIISRWARTKPYLSWLTYINEP